MVKERMHTFFTLPVLMLVLTGCHDSVFAVAALPNTNRTIATIYKIQTNETNNVVQCYRISANGRFPVTRLRKNQKVEIAAIEDGLRRFEGELWLNVYPPLSHRPACYVNINNLIPYS